MLYVRLLVSFLCFVLKLNKTIKSIRAGAELCVVFEQRQIASFITAAPVNPDKLPYARCLKGRRWRRQRMHHTQQVTCKNLHTLLLLLLGDLHNVYYLYFLLSLQ